MFKMFKRNDKYFTIAVYAFLAIAALIGLCFLLFNLNVITSWLGGIVGAMSSFIYGFIIAYLCNSIYKKFNKHVFKFVEKKKPHPKLRKGLSIFCAYIVFGAVIALISLAIFPQLVANIKDLSANIDVYIENFRDWFYNFLNGIAQTFPSVNPDEIMSSILSIFTSPDGESSVDAIINFLSNNVVNIGSTVVNHIFSIIVGLILSVYFLIYKEFLIARIKRFLCAFLSQKRYENLISFTRYTDKTFGRYIIGAICDSTLVGIVLFIILKIFNFPLAPLIAVTCGITNIIPFFGPFIGSIPSGVVILIATGDPLKVVLFAVIILVLQQIDGNIIAPHIIGASTGLTPIGVIAAVTLCSHLFGFFGMVVGVPLCAVVTYLCSGIVDKKLKKRKLPTQVEYYRVEDIYLDEHFAKARHALEAEEKIAKSTVIANVAAEKKITDEVLQEIEEKVVENVLITALDEINEKINAKKKDGDE